MSFSLATIRLKSTLRLWRARWRAMSAPGRSLRAVSLFITDSTSIDLVRTKKAWRPRSRVQLSGFRPSKSEFGRASFPLLNVGYDQYRPSRPEQRGLWQHYSERFLAGLDLSDH